MGGARRPWSIATFEALGRSIPRKVRIGGRHWEKTLAELVAEAALGLGVSEPVAADFYKLLVYDTGSFFVDHRDTEKVPGMFATMVLVLPSIHSGGELVVQHLGREVMLDPRPEEPSEIGFAAFYADCVHEVRPVTTGYRLTLIYNLRFLGKRRSLEAPDYRAEQARVAEILRSWASAEDEPDKLILPLGACLHAGRAVVRHAQGRRCRCRVRAGRGRGGGGLRSPSRPGVDRGERQRRTYRLLRPSALEPGRGGRRRVRGRRGLRPGLILSEWRRPDGGEAGFDDFPFTEDELCPPDAFEDLTPDEQHFHEATGNEGASFERTYRRAGLVLWPRARRLAVLNQAGLGATLPYLEDLTTRWETSDGSDRSHRCGVRPTSFRATCCAPGPARPGARTTMPTPVGCSTCRSGWGTLARIDAFLAELSAEGHYTASDNEAIVRAAALLPRPRATDLLVRIVRRNAAAHLGACGDSAAALRGADRFRRATPCRSAPP